MTTDAPRLVRVGRVAGAFGVRGEVRITAYTQEPLALLDYQTLRRADGSPALTLVSGREAKGTVIARAREIAAKEQADALRGLDLYVAREALPATDEDEFYAADLIGLDAVTPEGAPLGKVRQVQDFGAGDLIEVQPADGGSWFVAFTRSTVPEVDLAAGRLVIVRPAEVSEKD